MKRFKIVYEKRSAGCNTTFTNRLWIRWAIKFFLSGLLLYLLLRSIEPALFWKTVRSMDATLLLISVTLFFPGQLLAAYRWYYLLKRFNRFIPYWSLVRHTVLGQLSAAFLPGRISGDIVRLMAVLHKESEKSILVLSVIVDKLALFVAVISFALLGVFASELASRFFFVYWIALVFLLFALLLMSFLCRSSSQLIPQQFVQFANRIPLAARFAPSLSAWSNLPRLSPNTVVAILGLAFILQLSYTIGGYLTALAMHIRISPIDWAAISAMVTLAQILPVTVGGLGVREGLFAGLLFLYRVPVEQSTAFSLVGFTLVSLLLVISWCILESTFVRMRQKTMKLTPS